MEAICLAASCRIENLQAKSHDELVSLVAYLLGVVRQKERSLELLQEAFDTAVDERDAARLLNELCHY